MNNTKNIWIAIAVITLFTCTQANAEFYAGAAAGRGKGYYKTADYPGNLKTFVHYYDNTRAAYGGFRYKLFEIEGGYLKLPTTISDGKYDGADGRGARTGHQEIQASARYIKIGGRFSIMRKLTITPFIGRANIKVYDHAAQSNDLIGYNEHTDVLEVTKMIYGVHIDYAFTDSWSIRGEFTTIPKAISSPHIEPTDYNVLQIGFEYKL